MPSVIDPQTMYIDDLPGVWTPIQWELSEEERVLELHEQAKASLLYAVNVPEAILRLLLNEVDIERAYEPPEGFDPDLQGEWTEDLITFVFRRSAVPTQVERERGCLDVTYKLEDLGYWHLTVEPERITIERV